MRRRLAEVARRGHLGGESRRRVAVHDAAARLLNLALRYALHLEGVVVLRVEVRRDAAAASEEGTEIIELLLPRDLARLNCDDFLDRRDVDALQHAAKPIEGVRPVLSSKDAEERDDLLARDAQGLDLTFRADRCAALRLLSQRTFTDVVRRSNRELYVLRIADEDVDGPVEEQEHPVLVAPPLLNQLRAVFIDHDVAQLEDARQLLVEVKVRQQIEVLHPIDQDVAQPRAH